MQAADSQGQGAIGVGGVMIDRAHVKHAEKILRRAALAEMTPETNHEQTAF
jgi:malyl-CoA/(S)-citramalyl-CoA lyase